MHVMFDKTNKFYKKMGTHV